MKKAQAFRPVTLEFINTCRGILRDIEQAIVTEAQENERDASLPDVYFVFGRVSIGSHLWPKLLKAARLIKDNDYADAGTEFELSLVLMEAIRLMVYRLAHTPPSDMQLPNPQDETARTATLGEIPAIRITQVSESVKSPTTKDLSQFNMDATAEETLPDASTNGLAELEKLAANGTNTDSTDNTDNTDAQPTRPMALGGTTKKGKTP